MEDKLYDALARVLLEGRTDQWGNQVVSPLQEANQSNPMNNEDILKEFDERNFILEFYPRTVLQKPYPAKDIKEIDSGILTPTGKKKIKDFIRTTLEKALKEQREEWERVDRVELLTDYTNWLCDRGYTDSDVYAEEPKAVDAYLEEFKNNHPNK